jgi:hypothetical protein
MDYHPTGQQKPAGRPHQSTLIDGGSTGALSPQAADTQPRALRRHRVEPFRQASQRGDRILGRRPLGRQIGRQPLRCISSGGKLRCRPQICPLAAFPALAGGITGRPRNGWPRTFSGALSSSSRGRGAPIDGVREWARCGLSDCRGRRRSSTHAVALRAGVDVRIVRVKRG